MLRLWAFLLGCTCCLPFHVLQAQSMEGGARVAAMGGAATALEDDLWGFANPASWATLQGGGASFFGSEGYGLDALRLAALVLAQSTRAGTITGGARTFGFEDYREAHFSAGYARGFSLGTARRFKVGVNLRYHRVSISGYGRAGALGLSLGLLVAPLEPLQVGFHATNLNVPRLHGEEELPRTLALGLAYRPAPSLCVLADLYKDVRFPLSARGGVEIYPVSALALRAGVTTAPTRFTTGTGVRLGPVAADVAAERHEVLGWSPAASFSIHW